MAPPTTTKVTTDKTIVPDIPTPPASPLISPISPISPRSPADGFDPESDPEQDPNRDANADITTQTLTNDLTTLTRCINDLWRSYDTYSPEDRCGITWVQTHHYLLSWVIRRVLVPRLPHLPNHFPPGGPFRQSHRHRHLHPAPTPFWLTPTPTHRFSLHNLLYALLNTRFWEPVPHVLLAESLYSAAAALIPGYDACWTQFKAILWHIDYCARSHEAEEAELWGLRGERGVSAEVRPLGWDGRCDDVLRGIVVGCPGWGKGRGRFWARRFERAVGMRVRPGWLRQRSLQLARSRKVRRWP
ncbi:hypothetical protein K402DRAFT_176463 [Aulographum hederae CBS 113979]|uniref:Uncharacterized protein n=1 Tax=Aulographum hederae CBS 113979 TaxID=1176131 RepID=A0A6G1GRA8_9PEZI|nr:hypothetical protein K402DRAFT_176463 [Aulographum hederae CBS 113979]